MRPSYFGEPLRVQQIHAAAEDIHAGFELSLERPFVTTWFLLEPYNRSAYLFFSTFHALERVDHLFPGFSRHMWANAVPPFIILCQSPNQLHVGFCRLHC